ncbi:MAG TPA: TIR domain-containing protein [Microvirga sp.]|jgi:hypothetical protein|nr:TIR domain-containing protein [Microvirga sp.]
MTNIEERQAKERRVFLSYAHQDREVAAQIVSALQGAGLNTWLDQWSLAPGDSILERVEDAVASADVLLVLLSEASVSSRWMQAELSSNSFARALADRAVAVIPALIQDCQIPPALADHLYLDLRHDRHQAIERLVAQLKTVSDVDLARTSPVVFERLVADLLSDVGFDIAEREERIDRGFDFAATFRDRDPFGANRTTSWLVEVKHYKNERVSVSSLQQLFGYLAEQPATTQCLLVTNGRLTSVARDFLEESAAKAGRTIRVLDGTELTNLLLARPDVVERHLPRADR